MRGNKHSFLFLLSFLLFVVILSGCVAQSKYLAQVAETESTKAALQDETKKNAALNERVSALNSQLAEQKAKLEKLEAEKADASRKINELSSTINGLNSDLEKAKEAARNDVEKSRAEMERISAERDEARKRNEELSSEIDKLRLKEREASEKIDSLNLELSKKGETEKSMAEIANLTSEKKRLLSELDHAKESISTLEKEKAKNIEIIDNLKNQMARLEEEKKAAEKRIAELESKTGNILSEAERAAAEAKRKEKELEETRLTYESLLGKLKKEVEEGNIKVEMLKKGLSLKIMEKILFDSGSDKISSPGKELLDRLSAVLKDVKDREIRIEGHTDNKPIGPTLIDKFPTNWDLSTSRASQVVKYLSKGGVDPNVMSAAGYSMYHPVASNDTKDGREQNRRIEVILYPKELLGAE